MQRKKTNEKYYSLSATILSLSISVIGCTNLELSEWWHFLVAIISIGIIYVFSYFFVSLVNYFYVHVIKLPSLEVDGEKKLKDLYSLSADIHQKYNVYISDTINEYKTILKYELEMLCKEFDSKIETIQKNVTNDSLSEKNEVKISLIDLQKYQTFIEYIKAQMNF